MLDDLGLGAAAEWLLEGLAHRASITYELKIDPSCADLSEPHASALFRVMPESLTNVARHARATRVSVRLTREGGELVLTITDDGVGVRCFGNDGCQLPRGGIERRGRAAAQARIAGRERSRASRQPSERGRPGIVVCPGWVVPFVFIADGRPES
ncbi:MAG TPA: ATP-binding protein, partial [Burkholderiales bacterium]|nr:ATP-binding protein [Burkholderiales bacterium]